MLRLFFRKTEVLRKVGVPSSCLALLTLLFPPAQVVAAPSGKIESSTLISVAHVPATRASTAATRVPNLALTTDDTLQGQLVSQAGIPLRDATVLINNGQRQWQAKSDAQGRFHFLKLRGGTYRIETAGQVQLVRVWAAGTAPPQASRGLLLTPQTDIIRGQRVPSKNTNQFFRVAKQRLANPWVVGGIVATAVAIPVAIHNSDDDTSPATP